jgi:hypothetical protein
MAGMAYLEIISGERGNNMKRVILLFSLLILFAVNTITFAATPFTEVVVTYDDASKALNITGASEHNAIAVFVYAPNETLKVFKTSFTDNGTFEVVFDNFIANQNGTYIVRLANYEGGAYHNYSFEYSNSGTVEEPPVVENPPPTQSPNPSPAPVVTPPVSGNQNPVLSEIKSQVAEILKNPIGVKRIEFSTLSVEKGTVGIAISKEIIEELAKNGFIISVSSESASYLVPSTELSQSKLAAVIGISENLIKDVKININVKKIDKSIEEHYRTLAESMGYKLAVTPVAFEITAKVTHTNGQLSDIDVTKFGTFVERIIDIPTGVNPASIKTGIVFNKDGSFNSVPTTLFEKDGKWYARLNSLTNSTYGLIIRDVSVAAVKGHWSEKIVNDMASRMIIEDLIAFNPDAAISRADFATYIVKALGLYRVTDVEKSRFTDIKIDNSLILGISIANEWGIVSGYVDGSFRPNATISREEAMAMYAKAMEVASLKASKGDLFSVYKDKNLVSDWAKPFVMKAVNANIFSGKGNQMLDPKGVLTHAESIAAIRNLLVEAGLVSGLK